MSPHDQSRDREGGATSRITRLPDFRAHRLLTGSALIGGAALIALMIPGCRDDMQDQPRSDPYEASDFFSDGQASREPPEHAIARGHLQLDDHLFRGRIGGSFVANYPFTQTRETLLRGRQKYNIYCAPCHDAAGGGNGIVVQRGFKRPESFHGDRLRQAPEGYLFDVISNGFGTMYDFADRIAPEDRWALVAYMRALQLSQHAPIAELPGLDRDQLQSQAGGSL